MKYLCLIYDEEKKTHTMSKSEGDAFMGEYFGFTAGIKKSGHYLGGNALQPVRTATTVRIRNRKVSTTDGPFAETTAQLRCPSPLPAPSPNPPPHTTATIPP